MASVYGNILKLSIFGQSHSPAIGCSLDGIPAGIDVDFERLQEFLNRRAPGRDETSTTRRESDPNSSPASRTDLRTGHPSRRSSAMATRAARTTTSYAASPALAMPIGPPRSNTAGSRTSRAGATSRGV